MDDYENERLLDDLYDTIERLAADNARLRAENAELRAELMEQCRVNGMGGEREARLRAENERFIKALLSITRVRGVSSANADEEMESIARKALFLEES